MSELIPNNNYLATNFFQLIIERIPVVSYFAQSVNLPSLTIPPIEVPAAQFGVPLRTPVGRYSYENMSVSFLVDEQMQNWLEVYNWLYSISTPEDVPGTYTSHADIFSDAKLLIKNSKYNTIKVVTIKDMFPVGISGIQFSSVVVDTEPVVATATFAFTTYTIEDVNESG